MLSPLFSFMDSGEYKGCDWVVVCSLCLSQFLFLFLILFRVVTPLPSRSLVVVAKEALRNLPAHLRHHAYFDALCTWLVSAVQKWADKSAATSDDVTDFLRALPSSSDNLAWFLRDEDLQKPKGPSYTLLIDVVKEVRSAGTSICWISFVCFCCCCCWIGGSRPRRLVPLVPGLHHAG